MSTKIVIIGSGSQFTDFFLQELYKAEEFRGCTLALVDRKAERLELEVALAKQLNASVEWDVRVEGYTDRTEAMEGADFVYVFIAVNQNEAWKKEFEIANKHGVHPLEAYTAGTAGLGMAIRHVPPMLDICADMERICPDAWLIMDNNPLAKIVAAVHRHANVKFVGYCNGYELVQSALEQLLDRSDRDPSTMNADPVEREFLVPAGNIALTLAGVNHCTWLLEVRDTATGEDLYPALRERVEQPELVPEGYRFSAEICRRFGYFPSPADNHLADYLWCTDTSVHEWLGMEPYPVDKWFGGRDADSWAEIRAGVDDPDTAREFIAQRRTGWQNVQICRLMLSGDPSYFPAINVVNGDAVDNLPEDIVVEVPGVLASDSIRAVRVGPLPDQVAPVCALHGAISNLVADAAATGCKQTALQALLLDPFVHSITKAEKVLDDILEYNRQYETRF